MNDLFESLDESGKPAPKQAKSKGKEKPAKTVPTAKAATDETATVSNDASAKKQTKPTKPKGKNGYSAEDIEVLEGLEPVRRRPGMYIGGTDETALHHLIAEILDNSMDEAVAGHASRIDLHLAADQTVTISDNGRGIPVDPHPKFKDKSALEVIMTTLHSGGKFSGKAYETSGGLHGVGISVVNALSDVMTVEVTREAKTWLQEFSRGKPQGTLKDMGDAPKTRHGTTVTFHPDDQIFGKRAHFRPSQVYRMARSKAYLFRGVEIRWSCDTELLKADGPVPETDTLHFPGGLSDFLASELKDRRMEPDKIFHGLGNLNGGSGRIEWAVGWPLDEDDFFNSYCNTVPTPQGGTHELGLRTALYKGLRAFGELVGNRQSDKITAEDVVGGACIMLSVFIHDPQFQGQTKDKLSTPEATKLVETSLRDHFDQWLSEDRTAAQILLERSIERADIRLKRRQEKKLKRQSATRRLRLPGKLADCTSTSNTGTELFLVEGDSAGGSAKQGRDRKTQAVLPLRGKILNVASATAEKMHANQEINDLIEALGCGIGAGYTDDNLRYEKIVIMTDADVDGAHIASLLMTFFFKEMRQLIENGHLYLALPPLYRISQGAKVIYARDDAHKDELMKTEFSGRGKIDISRFKGLGEMPPAQLKETTMSPKSRTLLRVTVPMGHDTEEQAEFKETVTLVEDLMGKKPEKRFAFIQEHAKFVDHDTIDV